MVKEDLLREVIDYVEARLALAVGSMERQAWLEIRDLLCAAWRESGDGGGKGHG